MNDSNPFVPPKTSTREPVRIRDQQLLRQVLLFSIFYLIGTACGFVYATGHYAKGLSAWPIFFHPFTDPGVWLSVVPYVAAYTVIRALTIGRMVRPVWWSFCIAGFATFPFHLFYMNLMTVQFNTPAPYPHATFLVAVISTIVTELLALEMLNQLFWRKAIAKTNAEQIAEPELPTVAF